MYGTVRVLRNIIYAATAKGGNLNKLCAALGINPSDLHDGDRKIEGVKPVMDLWTEVMASTGDHAFGLHMGLENKPCVLGLLGYLMQSCRTVGEAFTEIITYQQTISGWISYNYAVGKECELTFSINPMWLQVSPETARQALETAISGALSYIYIFTGQKVYPLRAALAYKTPVSKAEYERIFHCPVHFEGEQNKLIFSKEVADMLLISYDESLYMSFAEILKNKSAGTGARGSFADQVKKVIIQDFYGKTPSLEIIAAHMNLSERSLQRRLQQENESYRSLGASIKQELAFNLLKNTDATVHAISEVLGYTEASAFHRAFKNWTQTSPVQKKRTLG
ncbi:AraC family transcriptional regulator [Dyadobacter fanqingshengii]|uniref:AraC family transcriptional regulator n=1 Tax=Dyadobacter fanqingshengii TaxID=2906443 RepID=A0A9X1P9P5_9BACT|nr:AraC family transcriptional regulator [Dyadobacter fanqingshengii]MCF0041229.1 AraC family transcriptional regulator [Dyadobacter fanqingshengii]USJ37046.1 AraC family transcriptional regulator [Dyadobacter fanqingshengii]